MQPVVNFTRVALVVVLASTFACRANNNDKDVDTSEANSPPQPASGIAVVTDEDASSVINLSATDADNDPLEFGIAVRPEHGTLSPEVPGRQSQVTYTPDPDFNGEDSFSFTVSDGVDTSSPEQVAITVAPVNDPPNTGAPILAETQEGRPVVVRLTATDIDDVDLTFRDRRQPLNGTLDTSALPDVTYTPNENFAGEDTFTYLASDGLLDSPEGTVIITVLDLNDAPVGTDDFYETDEDRALVVGAPGVLGNDTDIDFDSLTARKLTDPSHGTVELNTDGSFTFTPGPNETSDVSFTYVASDGVEDSEPITVTVELDSINDRPIGVVDEYELSEDDVGYVSAFSVLVNDELAEIDGDPLLAILGTTTSNGALALFEDGTFTYTPNPNFNGVDTFTYQATDGPSVSDRTTVTLRVLPENDAPVAVRDNYSTAEDTVLVRGFGDGLLANDSDVDLDELSVVVVDLPSFGGVVVDPDDGSFTYTPEPDFNGVDTFTYQAEDPSGARSAVTAVNITVDPRNDPPTADDDSFDGFEDVPLVVLPPGVIDGDSDLDGDVITALQVAPPVNGVLDLDGDGSFTYTPFLNFNGVDSFTYQVTDGRLQSSVATVTLNIADTNDAPEPLDDVAEVDEDAVLVVGAPGILGNDTDRDLNEIIVHDVVDEPEHGSLSWAADGSYRYEPDDDYNGPDGFTYLVRDEEGAISEDVATVSITVVPTNDVPVVVDDEYETDEDLPLAVATRDGVRDNLLTGDFDIDGDPLVVELVASASLGALTLRADGSFNYSAAPNVNGVDGFTYRVFDGSAYSAVASVTIVVNPVNDRPVAVADVYATREDVALVPDPLRNLLANDSDIDGDALAPRLTVPAGNGVAVIEPDGRFTYTPSPGFNGLDTFTYVVNDGRIDSLPAVVSVNVGIENDAPIAVDDALDAIEDTDLVVGPPGVLGNDSDPDDPGAVPGVDITAQLNVPPAHGLLVGGLLADGSFTYRPDPDFNGPDSFTYFAFDGVEFSGVATVAINVAQRNDGPVADADAYSVAEDTRLDVTDPAEGVLAGDTDIDLADPDVPGDRDDVLELIAVLVDSPLHDAAFDLNDDGTFTYLPDPDYNGVDTFTYRAQDPSGTVSAPATVTITVTPQNDAPVAGPDGPYVVDEDTSLVVDAPGLLVNDSDVDMDGLAVDLETPASNGSVLLSGDGSFVYTPNRNFNGVDFFEYVATDGRALSTPTLVTINVLPVNDRPVALSDAYVTDEDVALLIDPPGVLSNDSDIDFDALSSFVVLPPVSGALSLDSDGGLLYTPDLDFVGDDFFTYVASDGVLDSDPATVFITVEPANDAPIGVDDGPYIFDEDTTFVAGLVNGVLRNDSDVDEDPLTAIGVGAPTNALEFELRADGTFTYTPNVDFVGIDTFTYRATDGLLNSAITTVTLDVQPINDAPVGVADLYFASEDTTLERDALAGVLANDTDADDPSHGVDDPLTAEVRRPPSNGDLDMNPDGSFTYTPDEDFIGDDTFTYQAFDGFLRSAYTTVTINVGDSNDAPDVEDDAYGVIEDTLLVVDAPGVLDNDSDPEGDLMSARVTVSPIHGALVLAADGGFEFMPEADYVGPDSFVYVVDDSRGATSAPATVTLTVGGENDAPRTLDDDYVVAEDVPLVVDAPGVLGNDTDLEGDAMSALLGVRPANGTVLLVGDGSFTYTGDANYNGPDSFTYQAFDGIERSAPTTVNITVTAVNDVAVTVDDNYVTGEDTPLSIDALSGVLSNDNDVESDPLSLTAVKVTDPANGSVALGADGAFVYTPNLDFIGVDSFRYQIDDFGDLSAEATVTITVENDDDAPVVADDAYDIDEDAVLSVPSVSGVLANDFDIDGEPLTADLVATTTEGVLSLNANGSFTYTPGPNFNGEDSFTYTANDGALDSAVATARITVNPVNDAPTAAPDAYAATEEEEIDISSVLGVLANDTDIDGDVLTATLVATTPNGSLALDLDGSFTYTSDIDFSGVDTFTYRVNDPTGPGDTAVVTITVGDGNDAPVGTDDAFDAVEDTVLDVPPLFGVLANDSDADGDPMTVSLLASTSAGALVLDADGSFVYTPAADATGVDSFTYQIADGRGGLGTATATITVAPVNDAPRPVADAFTVDEDVLFVSSPVSVLDNDVEVDGDPLIEAVVVANPLHGDLVLAGDGTWEYDPDPNYHGPDSFQYRARDGFVPDSVPSTVTITVAPVNDAPTGVADIYDTREDEPLVVDSIRGVLANDSDVDGDALTAVILSPPPLGSVSLALDGSFTYTPAADFAGPESFTYQADDGALLSSAITVTINVGAEDDAPIVVDDAYVVTEDTVLNVDRFAGMLSNDFDLEGESLTVVGIDALPVLGTLTFNANGSFVYTPFVDEDGDGDGTTVDDTFTYRVSDGTFEVVGLVEITIDPVNDAPRGLPDAFVTDEDTPIIAGPPGLLGNDTDVEGDAFVATLISEPSHGALVLDPDGTFVYTPAPDYNGEDFFRYAPEDDDLGATLTVNLTINPVNDVPVPTADTYVVNEDTLLGGNVMDNDLDVDSLVLTVALVDDVSNGTLSLASDGTFTYTPDPDWFSSPAPDQFTYNLSDGLAVVGPTTVDITVTAQGDVPRGVVDAYGTLEDTPLVVGVPGVLGNDVEVDGAFPFEGEAITAELVVGPPNGDVSLNSDGSFTYTPDLNYNLDAGPETFTYRPVDGDGPGATVTVTLSVDPVNDIPVSADDLYVPTEDVLFTADVLTGVLANDTDVEGDALTAVLVDTTVSGLLALSSDGSFTYQPDPDFDGVDSFTYRATDSEAGTLGTVTLTVGAVNDRPTCVGDGPFVTSEDNPLDTVSSVLANDDDIDADPLTATLVGSVANGALTLRPDGTFLYTPNAHYNGPDSFTYRPSDGIITSVDLCSVSINVTPVNDAPVAAVEAYVMDEDEVLSIGALAGVLANDSDIDSGLLTASVVAPPASGVLNLISDGSFTYTPAPNVNGLITFTYQVSDGALTDTAVVSINISAVNDAPVALADAYDATEDAPLVVGALEGLIANDSDVDLDLLTTTVDTPPTKGALALASNGSFTYTPNANANGIDSFVYSLSDGALTDTATVTIDITAENDAPVAVDDSYAIDEDGVLSVLAAAGVRANDTDVETLTSDLTIAVLDSTDDGALSLAANGSFTYTPDANFNGVDSFTYTVSDGVLTGTGTATITVNPINDAPVGVDDAYPMDEDTVLTVAALAGVLINDTDVDVGASLTAATVTDEPDDGIVDLNSDGSFDYTPNPDFFGVDTFTYRVTDGVLNDTATVTITVSNVQDAPVAVDDVAAVTEDGVLAVSPPGVLANDSDVDGDALTSTILVGPIHGTLTFAAGGASVNGDGSYRYTPDPDYFGPDSFTYEADDGIDTTAATVNITVNPLGDVPVASDDAYVMAEDGFLSPLGFENLLANDSDDDGEPLTVNTSPIVAPTNGVLVLDSDGGFDYTPNPDFNGVDSFVYEISDPGGDTAQATATITVNPVNDAPVAVADSYDVDEDLVLSVGPVAGVRSNDTDVDGDALSITSLVLPTNGTLSLNVDGSFVYD
ncbi:MAG: VCBS repeat-containing protein, partial [Myxococcota bacterium]